MIGRSSEIPTVLQSVPEPEPEPLLAAVRVLIDLVGEETLSIVAHRVPLAFFADDRIRGQRTYVDEGGAWVSGGITIRGHQFRLYSERFPTETPKDEPEIA